MGGCCSDIAGARQAVGEVSKNVADGRAEVLEAVNVVAGKQGFLCQLAFNATKVLDRDYLSKSDPMLVAYVKRRDGALEEVGRTEVVLNNLNPSWITQLSFMFNFEEIQPLLFRVYDVDSTFHGVVSEKLKLDEQNFLGEMECLLSEIITAHAQKLTRSLLGRKDGTVGRDRGTLTVRAEELARSKYLVEMKLQCSDLDNKDLFSKSDPFLIFSRLREDGSAAPTYRTEVKKNNLNPSFKPIKVTLAQLCNGDVNRTLRIDCCNFNNSGKPDHIGMAHASVNELKTLSESGRTLDLMRTTGHSAFSKAGGKLHIESCTVSPYNSFLDYIFGGCEINFMVAVDFTASNGSPYQPDSLHYADPSGRPNAYQASILAVGEVLQFYDTDKRYPAWGFGGRPIDGPVSHCFALNGNQSAAEVDGIQGILYAYSQALRHVALAGPTLFAPVISMASSIASQYVSQEQQKYFVLLIITDGVITDPQQTVAALVSASPLPLSVLIIGVGGADFTEMENLDADKKRLVASDGRVAIRDIVQFVPMRDVTKGSELAKELLAELPYQLLDFMNSKGIVPGKRRSAPPVYPPNAL